MSLPQMSLAGAAMILVIVLIRALALHKLPKRFFLALWGVAAARLLIPVSLPSTLSVYSLLGPSNQPEVYAQAGPVFRPVPGASTGAPTVSAIPPAAHTIDIWTAVWLTGVAVCALFFGLAWLKCRREFRESLPVINRYTDNWLWEHRIYRTISIRQSDRITAPLTYGLYRPVLLMPKSTDWADTETLDYVLAHEFVHITRFDGLFKLLLAVTLCVHWFNPLVWVMAVLANRDIELSCDEAVLRQFGAASQTGYAMALISMEERKSGFAPWGSHFSKNAIEERITAIMKISKKSIAALAVSVALMGGTMGVFATSAKAETEAAHQDPQYTYTDTDECTFMSRTGPDGTVYYSLDGGDTWIEMTEEEFEAEYGSLDIEWWTAEEYAAWLENEKEELQKAVGSKGWTQGTGWFTWTQELVNETIAGYEQTLEDIRSGLKISKPVAAESDGAYDTAIMYGYDPGVYEVEKEKSDAAADEEYRQQLLKEYEKHGLTYDAARNTMSWNGRTVRFFTDSVESGQGFSTAYQHWDENGSVYLRTVREAAPNGDGSIDPAGKLVNIREMTAEELETLSYVQGEINAGAERTEENLAPYAPLGLTHQVDFNGRLTMTWQGKPVRSLFDPERQLWVANSMGEGGLGKEAVDLEAVYENGMLTGLRQIERDFELVEAEIIEADKFTEAKGGSGSTGMTLSERMEKFEPYGVAYEESNGKRAVLYQGQPVGKFIDLQPDGSVFTVQSTEGGAIDLAAAYDSNGNLYGVEIVQ